MRKRERKGFTLIELLATIAILAVVSMALVFVVTQILDKTEESKNEITLSSIKKSAISYSEEFKQEDKYWFVESYGDTEEYSCTTVGMLINKGILKSNILDAVIIDETTGEEKEISKETSVSVRRDKNTKVLLKEDIEFDAEECLQDSEISVEFKVEGTYNDETDYYTSIVTITTDITNEEHIYEKNYELTLNNRENSSDNYDTVDNVTTITEEGKNIDFCINIINLKDVTEKFCLSDDNPKINIDRTPPENPTMFLNNEFDILAKDATDNVTPDTEIKYILEGNENKGSINYDIQNDYRTQGKEIIVTVIDEAGNVNTVRKELIIDDSNNSNITPEEKYTCSLTPGVNYNSMSSAQAACEKITMTDPTPVYTYVCDYDGEEYTDKATAESNCYHTKSGDKTYSCDSGDSRSGSTCSYSYVDYYTVSGYCKYSYPCVDGKYGSGTQSCTDKGCGTGTKLSFTCESVEPLKGSCTSKGSLTQSCTNSCKKTVTETYDADCSCSISGKSCSNCKKKVYDDVTTVTEYSCSINDVIGSSYDEVASECYELIVGSAEAVIQYYCPLTKESYPNENTAVKACTNYCENGDYYDNACYQLK